MENFESFTGGGLASTPSAGQLDSDVWQISGLSDGDSTFGGDHASGDFARGLSGGSVITGGVYAFDTASNRTLGAQPTGADLTPGSFTLKVANTTGNVANQFSIDYDIWHLNDENRSVSFNLSYSTDNNFYNALPGINFATPLLSDVSGWDSTSLNTSINVAVPAGGDLFFRWTIADAGGSGSRDQISLDNIVVVADLETVSTTNLDLRIVSYNVENNPGSVSEEANFETIFSAIGQETYSGIVRPIDLLVLQETDSDSASRIESIFDDLYTEEYSAVISNSSSGDRFGFVWNTETLNLLETEILSGPYTRDPFRGLFQPVGAIPFESEFHVFDVHLNASSSSTRLTEANSLRAEIDSLGADQNVLVIGDLNIDSSFEDSYASLLADGVGQVLDPLDAPGTWHNNDLFRGLHTQDPSSQMDDRFDFQLVNDDVLSAGGLEFIPGTYRAFGNNGTHNLDSPITSGSGASSVVLSALAAASDHLPVVADYRFEVPDSGPTATIALGSVNRGVAVDDAATGTGFIMFSSEDVFTRFSAYSGNSAHLIAVRYFNNEWQYNDNNSWLVFTPNEGDRLLADVDFSVDTIGSLQGLSGQFEGIEQGFISGDLVFSANQWNGRFNPGEFTITGTSFEVSGEDPGAMTFALGAINRGIAVDDAATGTGFIMYSVDNVFTRLSAFSGNSDQLIAVRFFNNEWQYNDNTSWLEFTPNAGDRLLAEVDFSADTITSLQGVSGQLEGIEQGFVSGDLAFFANQWNGGPNLGEFTITGTSFGVPGSNSGNVTIALGNINRGVAVDDAASGTGFIMFSNENVFSRFSAYSGNSAHLIAVRFFNDQWQFNDNNSWQTFIPETGDRLLASVNFSTDIITSLQGASGQLEGIEQGFVSGDLAFFANQWNGGPNLGEFTVTGTSFEVIDSGTPTISLGNINRGVAVDDAATGTGFIMFSNESVFSRFSAYSGNSAHLIAVRFFNNQWQYNDNTSWLVFSPASDDRLLAEVDFSADTITSLQGNLGQIQGIDQGFTTGDLEFFANQWNGGTNLGEFTITGSYFS